MSDAELYEQKLQGLVELSGRSLYIGLCLRRRLYLGLRRYKTTALSKAKLILRPSPVFLNERIRCLRGDSAMVLLVARHANIALNRSR